MNLIAWPNILVGLYLYCRFNMHADMVPVSRWGMEIESTIWNLPLSITLRTIESDWYKEIHNSRRDVRSRTKAHHLGKEWGGKNLKHLNLCACRSRNGTKDLDLQFGLEMFTVKRPISTF